jgi:hypothetical protein
MKICYPANKFFVELVPAGNKRSVNLIAGQSRGRGWWCTCVVSSFIACVEKICSPADKVFAMAARLPALLSYCRSVHGGCLVAKFANQDTKSGERERVV